MVPDVRVRALQGMAKGVAVHAELVGNHDHVQNRVPVRVLGVRVGSFEKEQVVDPLVAKAGRPR